MYNYIKQKNRQKERNNIFLGFCIIILCIIIASAQPLSVAATEVSSGVESTSSQPISYIGGIIAGLVASGVATYCVSAGVGLTAAGAAALAGMGLAPFVAGAIVVVCVGLGAAILVSGIVTAINKAYELGYFQSFVDRLVSALNGGILSMNAGKLVIGVSIFSYIYNWVKEHIVGYFNEQIINTDLSAALNGYELYVPNCIFENGRLYDNALYNALNIDGNYYIYNLHYSDVSDLVSDGSNRTFQSDVINFTNTATKLKCKFQTNMIYSIYWGGARINFQQDFIFGENGNSVISCRYQKTDSAKFAGQNSFSKFKFFYPYVYLDNNGNKYLDMASRWYWYNNNTENDWPLFGGGSNEWYYNGVKLEYNANTRKVTSDNGSKVYTLVLADETEITTFLNLYNFMYYVFCKYCTINVTNTSNGEIDSSEKNAALSTTTTNPYYNGAQDILRNTADTVASGVLDGSITDETEGDVKIGISSLPGIDGLSDQTAATSSTAVTDMASVTDMTSTDVITDGTVVEIENGLIDISTAMIIAGGNIRSGSSQLRYKFPFDVIKSVSDWLSVLVVEGEPLVIDYTFVAFHHDFNVHIDFNRYQTLVTVGNWIVLVSVAIGLLLASKKAIEAI